MLSGFHRITNTISILFLLSGVVAIAGEIDGVADTQEKAHYNLFNPTPQNALREFATDRPDKTEGPTTVDAGHFQIEMDFATFTRNQVDSAETEIWNVAPFNLRIGLLNNVDLSLIFENYVRARLDDRRARTVSTASGVGDFITRVKINFWGNDGGSTAFAALPFVKFPTNTGDVGNDSVEGGLLLPFSVQLPGKFDLGMETGIQFLRNEFGSGRHQEFINSVTLGRDLVGELAGYCEFFSSVSTERDASWVGTIDVGLTYRLTKNLQLDCGCNIGVTHAADDINTFSGISVRF